MAPTGDQVALALGRLRWVVHAARVVAAARRFRALAEKANFYPDQPRVPRGHGRESGRWTYVEGRARDESELPVIWTARKTSFESQH